MIGQTKEDGSVPVKIRYIDLRLGSKCQLACVMCSPHDSSGWIKEWQQMHPQIKNEKLKSTASWNNKGKDFGASYNWHKNNPKFWADLMDPIPNMYQLYFAGGEALIIDEHYELLEEGNNSGHDYKIVLKLHHFLEKA